MDAKKCDRCGKYYDPDVNVGYIGEDRLFQHHGCLYFYPVEDSPHIDLCPECSDRFESWLNEVRNEKIREIGDEISKGFLKGLENPDVMTLEKLANCNPGYIMSKEELEKILNTKYPEIKKGEE